MQFVGEGKWVREQMSKRYPLFKTRLIIGSNFFPRLCLVETDCQLKYRKIYQSSIECMDPFEHLEVHNFWSILLPQF